MVTRIEFSSIMQMRMYSLVPSCVSECVIKGWGWECLGTLGVCDWEGFRGVLWEGFVRLCQLGEEFWGRADAIMKAFHQGL